MPSPAPCPWCRAAMRKWFAVPRDWRRPRIADGYQLMWCDACGYGALDRIPDAAAIDESYAVGDYEPHVGTPASVGRERGLGARLRLHLAWQFDRGEDLTPAWIERHCGKGPLEVCDLGCGAGELALALQRAGHRVTCIEPSPVARAAAARRGVAAFAGTAEALPVEVVGRTFDAVILSHVLEHCRGPATALANVRELLAPQGRAILEVPNNECRGLAWRGLAWHWLDVPRHLHFFTARSLASACRAAGLAPLATSWRGYTRQFQESWLATERTIGARLGRDPGPTLPLLLCTLLASKRRKYDSVRIIAGRAPALPPAPPPAHGARPARLRAAQRA